MQIPNIFHMKAAIYFNIICGAWPVFKNKKRHLYICYEIYFVVIFITALLYTISDFVAICYFNIVNFDLTLLTNNMICATINAIAIIRAVVVRREGVKNLIMEIWKKEEQIYESNDKKIIDIYNDNANKNLTLNYYYWISQFVDSGIYLYIIYPIFSPKVPYYDPVANVTIYEKRLPLTPWFPFDEHKHHVTAYVWEEVATTLCLLFNYGTDLIFYSLITYILGQINILNHLLNEIEYYSQRIQKQLRCNQERADLVTLKLCIREHQRVVSYINNFNDALRSAMLLDFLQSSLQLGVLTIFLMNEPYWLARALAIGYITIMLARLAVYYWYANEIMILSWSVADNVYNTKWYDKPKTFKENFVLFLMACNKQTGLEIGPLSIMSWNIFYGIIKGAYSFITFVLQR